VIEIKNGPNVYRVGERVGEFKNYHLYICIQNGTERQCLLQIATDIGKNDGLVRAVYILKELKRRAVEIEKEYESVKKDPNVFLNYDIGFPEVVDSFICQEQGGRCINILAFKSVEKINHLVPLSNLVKKDHLRIDFRTSAWIMGKLLKLLAFMHSEGISAKNLSESSILIEPDQHYVLIFDWFEAKIYPESVPKKIRCREISEAARAVIIALGGDPKAGAFPDDEDKVFGKYTECLLRLARGEESNAQKAHDGFYELIDSLWERKFYPFTAKHLMV
jgi:hypothetical protein